MSKRNELRVLVAAVAATLAIDVGAQGLSQLPGASVPQQPRVSAAGRAAPAAQAQAQTASGAQQRPEEEVKPRNPLEEISRLNAEIANLKAKLQIADIKGQIAKKEAEMNPPAPKAAEKKEEIIAKPAKREEPKPSLPPLPNLNALLPPSSAGGAAQRPGGNGAQQQGQSQGQSQGQAQPRVQMDPQLIAVEGLGDNLKAELITDWGGWAEVGVGDKYYDWKVEEIKASGVVLSKGKTRMSVAMTNSRVNRLQMQTMMSRNMPTSGGAGGMGAQMGMPPGGPMGAPMGGPQMPGGGFGTSMAPDGSIFNNSATPGVPGTAPGMFGDGPLPGSGVTLSPPKDGSGVGPLGPVPSRSPF